MENGEVSAARHGDHIERVTKGVQAYSTMGFSVEETCAHFGITRPECAAILARQEAGRKRERVRCCALRAEVAALRCGAIPDAARLAEMKGEIAGLQEERAQLVEIVSSLAYALELVSRIEPVCVQR